MGFEFCEYHCFCFYFLVFKSVLPCKCKNLAQLIWNRNSKIQDTILIMERWCDGGTTQNRHHTNHNKNKECINIPRQKQKFKISIDSYKIPTFIQKLKPCIHTNFLDKYWILVLSVDWVFYKHFSKIVANVWSWPNFFVFRALSKWVIGVVCGVEWAIGAKCGDGWSIGVECERYCVPFFSIEPPRKHKV